MAIGECIYCVSMSLTSQGDFVVTGYIGPACSENTVHDIKSYSNSLALLVLVSIVPTIDSSYELSRLYRHETRKIYTHRCELYVCVAFVCYWKASLLKSF